MRAAVKIDKFSLSIQQFGAVLLCGELLPVIRHCAVLGISARTLCRYCHPSATAPARLWPLDSGGIRRPFVKRSRLAAIGIAALMIPGVAGCWSGNSAATTVQSASGDGTQVDTPDITIDSATLVAGEPGSGKAAFLATVYNPTQTPDELVSITAGGVEAKLTPSPVPVPNTTAISIQTGKDVQADFAGLEAETGTYVDVTMMFANAGEQTFTALLVPPSGFYASAAPEGTTPLPPKVKEKIEGLEGGTAEEGAAGTEPGAMTEPGTAVVSPSAAPEK